VKEKRRKRIVKGKIEAKRVKEIQNGQMLWQKVYMMSKYLHFVDGEYISFLEG
jgi:hypothetical protein